MRFLEDDFPGLDQIEAIGWFPRAKNDLTRLEVRVHRACGENRKMAFTHPGEEWVGGQSLSMLSLQVSGNGSVAGEILVFMEVSLGEMRCRRSPEFGKSCSFFGPPKPRNDPLVILILRVAICAELGLAT